MKARLRRFANDVVGSPLERNRHARYFFALEPTMGL